MTDEKRTSDLLEESEQQYQPDQPETLDSPQENTSVDTSRVSTQEDVDYSIYAPMAKFPEMSPEQQVVISKILLFKKLPKSHPQFWEDIKTREQIEESDWYEFNDWGARYFVDDIRNNHDEDYNCDKFLEFYKAVLKGLTSAVKDREGLKDLVRYQECTGEVLVTLLEVISKEDWNQITKNIIEYWGEDPKIIEPDEKTDLFKYRKGIEDLAEQLEDETRKEHFKRLMFFSLYKPYSNPFDLVTGKFCEGDWECPDSDYDDRDYDVEYEGETWSHEPEDEDEEERLEFEDECEGPTIEEYNATYGGAGSLEQYLKNHIPEDFKGLFEEWEQNPAKKIALTAEAPITKEEEEKRIRVLERIVATAELRRLMEPLVRFYEDSGKKRDNKGNIIEGVYPLGESSDYFKFWKSHLEARAISYGKDEDLEQIKLFDEEFSKYLEETMDPNIFPDNHKEIIRDTIFVFMHKELGKTLRSILVDTIDRDGAICNDVDLPKYYVSSDEIKAKKEGLREIRKSLIEESDHEKITRNILQSTEAREEDDAVGEEEFNRIKKQKAMNIETSTLGVPEGFLEDFERLGFKNAEDLIVYYIKDFCRYLEIDPLTEKIENAETISDLTQGMESAQKSMGLEEEDSKVISGMLKSFSQWKLASPYFKVLLEDLDAVLRSVE